MSKFAERFRFLKDINEMKLKDLSEALDITIPNLSYYMKGREPSYDVLIKIADYFDVSTDWLIGRIDTRDSQSFDIISIIQKDFESSGYNKKMSQNTSNEFAELVDIIRSILDDLYMVYNVLDRSDEAMNALDDELVYFLQLIHKYTQQYTNLLVSNGSRIQINKENVTTFLENTYLISEVAAPLMTYPATTYAEMLSKTTSVPDSDHDAIHLIKDFIVKSLEMKYPPRTIVNMLGQIHEIE